MSTFRRHLNSQFHSLYSIGESSLAIPVDINSGTGIELYCRFTDNDTTYVDSNLRSWLFTTNTYGTTNVGFTINNGQSYWQSQSLYCWLKKSLTYGPSRGTNVRIWTNANMKIEFGKIYPPLDPVEEVTTGIRVTNMKAGYIGYAQLYPFESSATEFWLWSSSNGQGQTVDTAYYRHNTDTYRLRIRQDYKIIRDYIPYRQDGKNGLKCLLTGDFCSSTTGVEFQTR